VDDRLLHGQVAAGWVESLGIRRVVLVSDRVAEDGFERCLYQAAAPAGVELTFMRVEGAAGAVGQLQAGKTICLVESVEDAERLVADGLAVEKVNLGGIHAGPGRKEYLPFVWLSATEKECCRRLIARGVRIEARMLPGSEGHDVAGLLGA
jgi:PTS system mannose-specific IIB component